MNVLVTGGTGFIGHHVVLHLLEWTDWDITVIDTHTYAGLPTKLLRDPRFDPDRVTEVVHDLREPLNPDEVPVPDVILHLASESHVDRSIDEPVPFITNNVLLTLNMLEYARIAEPNLFVLFSTDEVYGPAPEGVAMKEWSPIIPSNPYSASKAMQEANAIAYWRTYSVPVLITNTMNVFGPRQNIEKFIPKAVQNLVAGIPVTVHATNDEVIVKGRLSRKWRAGSRYYTYTENVAHALKFLITRNQELGPAMYPEADRPERFNLVGQREIANDELVYLAADILGVEPKIEWVEFHKTRPGHDRRYALDGEALFAEGWKEPVPFDLALRQTVFSYVPR